MADRTSRAVLPGSCASPTSAIALGLSTRLLAGPHGRVISTSAPLPWVTKAGAL